ncbi:hypothetical protein BpHYR1_032410 [Brachionus plicatilis]|uniref:Uncharacterized protein n=1 Tax=Brachionus plicatilis TaxID=10195 RepID=A0A3M7Q166_BRAPC|nr:hypothetical protein BpHYR1_032410 [Brachionus plicatilis]
MEQEEVPKESVPSDLELEASNNQKSVSSPNNCIFSMVLHTSDVRPKQSTVHLHTFADSSQTPKINHSSVNLHSGSNLSKHRENFFTNRVASLWNELPDTVVYAKSTSAFKDKSDKFRSQQLAANDTTIVE